MKRKIIVAAIAVLFSGLAFAAGDTAVQGQAGSREDRTGATEPSVGGGAPVTKHQGQETREVTRLFDKLDKNRDGAISSDEAQAMPELANYWKQHNLGNRGRMTEAEFAQFESQLQTGTDIYKSKQGGPEGLPATEHQKEAVEKGKSPDSGTSGGTENRGDQYSR